MQFFRVVGYIHALATATRNRLENNRIAYIFGGLHSHFNIDKRVAALGHRYAGWLHSSSGYILVAYLTDGNSQGAYPGQAGTGDHIGKICIF